MNLHHFLLMPLAYLDPGSGSFIIQIVIATMLGGALAIKAFWSQITGFFRRGKTSSQEDSTDQPS